MTEETRTVVYQVLGFAAFLGFMVWFAALFAKKYTVKMYAAGAVATINTAMLPFSTSPMWWRVTCILVWVIVTVQAYFERRQDQARATFL